MNYSKLNNLTGWLIFALGAIVYLLTTSPTASFWDCGEFIACANEFMVPHPPGAPLFLLIGRIFIIFGFGPENAAYMMNLMSVFASAFTGLFTFWTITMLAKRIVAPNTDNPDKGKTYAILAAGIVGGATVFFCSSFWFNAVEAEVYALSSTFSALIFWLMMKWEARAHLPGSYRYVILIAFIIGLSFGVHLLSLLTIPALALVYYFRVYKFSWGGFLASLGLSVGLLGVVQIFMGVYTFRIAFWFEKLFTGTVNTMTGETTGFGMPMWTGSIIFFLLLFGGLGYGIYWTAKKQKVVANVALLAALFVYIGMSSYALVFIRAATQPPINENDPDNMAAIVPYMEREQYGQVPLLYGPMYNAQAISQDKVGDMFYTFEYPVDIEQYGPEAKVLKQNGVTTEQLNSRYVAYAEKTELSYAPGGERFFPRMHARDKYRINFDGGIYHGSYINYVSQANQKGNANPMDDTPSGGENLAFFFDYQVGHMYLRYFGWNFIGRSGDEQSSGSELFYRASKYDNVPAGAKAYVQEAVEYDKEQEDRNHYYALPLLLGLLGLAFQITRDPKNAAVIGMLFLAGGLAIVLYLNQPPLQPRERDYSYAGSFTTFCIWIGLGVLAAWELLRDQAKLKSVTAAALAGVFLFAAVPMNMMAVNWTDHTRAGRYVAPDSALNLLESCEKNAILFTNGDNDTFPLWYLQEVEGIRTDVRVVNLSLLNTDWYIQGLLKQQNEGAPVPINLPETYFMGEKHAMEVLPKGVLPIKLPTHKDHLLKKGVITETQHATMGNDVTWNVRLRGNERRWYLMKQDLMIVEMLRNIAKDKWERPFYFAITIPDQSYIGLQPFFSQEGMAQRVLPVNFAGNGRGGEVNLDKMYDNLVNKFQFRNLGQGSEVYLDANIERMLGNFRNNYARLSSEFLSRAERNKLMIQQAEASENDSIDVEALRKERKAFLEKAKTVVDKSRELISYEVCEAKSYIHSQHGEIYAKLSKEGYKTEQLAREELELARKRARISLVQTLARLEPGQQFNPQRNFDLFALNAVKETYNTTLSDKAKAIETLEEMYNLTGMQFFQQELNRLKGDAGKTPQPGALPIPEDAPEPDPAVQEATEEDPEAEIEG